MNNSGEPRGIINKPGGAGGPDAIVFNRDKRDIDFYNQSVLEDNRGQTSEQSEKQQKLKKIFRRIGGVALALAFSAGVALASKSDKEAEDANRAFIEAQSNINYDDIRFVEDADSGKITLIAPDGNSYTRSIDGTIDDTKGALIDDLQKHQKQVKERNELGE